MTCHAEVGNFNFKLKTIIGWDEKRLIPGGLQPASAPDSIVHPSHWNQDVVFLDRRDGQHVTVVRLIDDDAIHIDHIAFIIKSAPGLGVIVAIRRQMTESIDKAMKTLHERRMPLAKNQGRQRTGFEAVFPAQHLRLPRHRNALHS